MRVDRLYLTSFKNLVNFEVDFDVSSPRQVLVGRNGVGKSNLLEALAWIFRDMDLEEPSRFGFEIEFHCNEHFVRVRSKASQIESGVGEENFQRTYEILEGSGDPKEHEHGRGYREIRESEFFAKNRPVEGRINPERLLPAYVFGYYSGVSGRLDSVFARHEERYYREQITGEEAALRPLFLAKPHHSQFALLSFFAARDEAAKAFLKDEFRIEGLESVLFALQEPYWNRGRRRANDSLSADNRFWGAGGKVSGFLSSLYKNSYAPMAGKQKKRISLGQQKNLERRYCFVPDEESLREIAKGFKPKEFFARLESMFFSNLIDETGQDIRIRVSLEGVDGAITYRELSEGEQQLLTIIGLMRFTAQNESLFLLDEPDTYLNPSWCLDFLHNLRKYGVEPPDSQVLITTHNPLTFSGLDKNEVVILERGRDGQINSDHPVNAPKGMGFQAILTSEFFGLRSTLDRETLAALDRKRELALKDDRSNEEDRELEDLDQQLGTLDFSKAVRDPLYLEFVKAMTDAQIDDPSIGAASPTKESWRIRQEIAADIVKRVKEREGELRKSDEGGASSQ